MEVKYYLGLLFLLLLPISTTCMIAHREMRNIHGITDMVYLESTHSVKKRSFNQKFRPFFYYDSTIAALSIDRRNKIKNDVIPVASDYFSSLLIVKATMSEIIFNRDCNNDLFFPSLSTATVKACKLGCQANSYCGPGNLVTIPEEHLRQCYFCDAGGQNCQFDINTPTNGSGVPNADYLFYVTSQSSGCTGNTIAFAGHCQQESAMDRPIAGYINFCESALMSNDASKLISTTKHEAIHAIAFTPTLFGYWRDSAGDPRTARDSDGRPLNNEAGTSTITATNYTWSTANGDITHTVSIMVTPEVVKAVREHFSCPTLLGAEIENQGGSGTAGAHWEQRIFGNEGLVGTFSSVAVTTFSKITLAALQDSGWYAVNYSMAEPLHWGRGLGCDFVTRSCLGWSNAIAPASAKPFCFSLNSSLLICNDDYSGIGICQISGYSQALPLDYQYFDSDPGLGTNVDRIGGTLQGADFCPVVPSFSNKVCTGSAPGFNTFDLQIYSPDSRCFTQPSRWSEGSSTQIAFGAGCHRFQCTPYGILIYVGNRFYNCSSEATNSILTFTNLDVGGTSYSGSIRCPPCEEICWDMLHLCSPSSNPQTTPPPQTGGMTTFPQTGGMTTSPQTGGMTTPSQTGGMTTPSQTGGMTTSPRTGGTFPTSGCLKICIDYFWLMFVIYLGAFIF